MAKHITDKLIDHKGRRTICEVHREIYDILYDDFHGEDREKTLELLNEAYVLAKKMAAKLVQYKHDYADEWYEIEKEEVIKEKLERRKNRK